MKKYDRKERGLEMNEAKRDRYIRLLKSKSNLSWIELTAEAAKEIVELLEESSRPQGEWKHEPLSPYHLCCSACGHRPPNDEYIKKYNIHMNFCPHCGADMRGIEHE